MIVITYILGHRPHWDRVLCLHYFYCYTDCECPSNMQLIGTPILCPGETALYRCTTTDLSRHAWGVNDHFDQFPDTDNVGDTITPVPGGIGYLLERMAEVNGLGNRTMVLFYTPDAGSASGHILNIQCSGGGGNCPLVTNFIGMIILYNITLSRRTTTDDRA